VKLRRLSQKFDFIDESKRQAQGQLESLTLQQQRQSMEHEQAEQLIGDSAQRLDALSVSVQDQSEQVRQLALQQQPLESDICQGTARP